MIAKTISSPDEMSAAGASAAKQAKAGDVYALVGDLGAGKTHWSAGFIGQLVGDATVSSPTFNIVNEYRSGALPVFHFDFYRMKSEDELINLGWDEYLDEEGVIICEWANLFPELMPKQTKWIFLEYVDSLTRKIVESDSCEQPSSGEAKNRGCPSDR